MTMQIQQTLNKDLQRFGLNPGEWTLKLLSTDQIQIQHKEDPAFSFMGVLSKELPAWEEIVLLTL